MTAIGSKARLEQEVVRLTQDLENARSMNEQALNAFDILHADIIYLLTYIVALQKQYGDDFPFPEIEARFPPSTWETVLTS